MNNPNILDHLFALPPVERQKVPFWFANYLVGENASKKRSIDTYIYYACFRTSFFVGLFFSVLNLLSLFTHRIINLGFAIIDLTGQDFVRTFLYKFESPVGIILLAFVLPYYLTYFLYHINPREFNIMWRNLRRAKIEYMKPLRAGLLGLFCIGGILVAMFGAYGLSALYMKGAHLENSFPYFLINAAALPFVMAVGNYMLLLLIATTWRFLGPHSNSS